MSRTNYSRKGCKDVFRSFLVRNATYDGSLEMPCIKSVDVIPHKLTVFSKSIRSKDFNSFVHFFEDDVQFERIWNAPNRYLPILKNFDGVITPDFSLYRDMPLVMQEWNTYRNRAIGYWLQEKALPLFPISDFLMNVRMHFAVTVLPKMEPLQLGRMDVSKSTLSEYTLKEV